METIRQTEMKNAQFQEKSANNFAVLLIFSVNSVWDCANIKLMFHSLLDTF